MIVKFINDGVYIINGKFLKGKKCRLKDNGKYNVLFISTAENILPTAMSLKIEQGRILNDKLNADIFDYENLVEIKLKEKFIDAYEPATVLNQQSFNYKSKIHTVTVYKDNKFRVSIEHNDKYLNHTIAEISEPSINNYGSTFLISGKADDKIYLLIILSDAETEDYKIIFENYVTSFKVSENGIHCYNELGGMLGTVMERVYRYDGKNYKLIEKNYKYRSPHNYPIALYPQLFLQAVKDEDFKLARSLVTEDLTDNIESVKNYLGTFDIIDPENKPLESFAEILTKINNVYYKRFVDFQFENNKISNIIKRDRKNFLVSFD